ncbi:unnamed protein product [Calypogeia fissa]
MGRGRSWSSSIVPAIAALVVVLAMGEWPSPVQSLHDQVNSYTGERFEEMVNVTASVSKAWRTGFHFQPRKNWMNDPNGPMYHNGYYHLFYQYDPFAALWGNITWGHAVSKDLIHWKYVDDAAIRGGPGWYDLLGAWSGSATKLLDGTPAMMYTGWSNVSSVFQIQTQNLVMPVNASDPLLKYWKKSDANPVIVAEPSMNASFFRDPTEAWRGKDGDWRILVGGQLPGSTFAPGTAYVYKSKDFVKWEYVHVLHSVFGTGMWECPDFYPVALSGKTGLEASAMSGGENGLLKHVMKVSSNNEKHDYYTLGTYDADNDTFTADDPSLDVAIGLRYDYGKFYASKTFFDYKQSRRILWGWINESTSDQNAVVAGWSGLQSIPRHIFMDSKTEQNLLQVPVEEVNGLHRNKVTKKDFDLPAGSVVPISGVSGPQLDIQVKFYKPEVGKAGLAFNGNDSASLSAQNMCSNGGGAAHRGIYGPFGVLVLADKDMQEQTAVYFYLSSQSTSTGSKWAALLCSDQSRSSLQIGVDETTYGSYVPVLESDKYLSLRILVDHSIVEAFGQGGRITITARVYPTVAIYDAAKAFLFNNGTSDVKVHSCNAWTMANIDIVQF